MSYEDYMGQIDKVFPFSSYRDGQKEAIAEFLQAWDDGKKHIIFEGPCGCGKSVIAYTLAQFFDRVFWVCPQKFLQDQIIKDFGTMGVVDLKGRSNYPCEYFDIVLNKLSPTDTQAAIDRMSKDSHKSWVVQPPHGRNCSAGVCRLRDDSSKCAECFSPGGTYCPYWKRLREAQESHICLMNFKSFLFQTTMAERFGPRDLIILDECHTAESEILDFVSMTIKDLPFKHCGISIPKMTCVEDYIKHFNDINILDVITEFANTAKYNGNYREEDEWHDLSRKIGGLIVRGSNKTWVFEHTELGAVNQVKFKPIFVNDIAYHLLFKHAQRSLMMSATILDPKHIQGPLGLNKEDIFTHRMKSRFPKENRPIYFTPSGSMNYRSKSRTYPILVRDVDSICNTYPDKRGMIHTHNFEIADLLLEECSSADRFLYQKDFKTKNEMLKEHAQRNNSIIIAPAMHEGLDLKDDLARFQLLVKVPYPNFMDNAQLKLRMEMDDEYYEWLTALKLTQCLGRVVRSEIDHADTYIMDEEFKRFYNRAQKMIPKWVKEAIIWS